MSIWKKKTPPPPKPPGKLIVIDGIDGAGKSTQLELLAKTLTEHNYDGMVFEFPQNGPVSNAMLSKYRSGGYGELNPEAVSILYAIDRLDASSQIREQIDDSKIILAKRYVLSNAAHQGSKIGDKQERIKFYRWLDHLEYSIFNTPRPDLTIVLFTPAQVLPNLEATTKIDGNAEDILKCFKETASLFPNTKLIDCSQDGKLLTPQEIHTKVWELVRRIALKNNSF